MNKLLDPLETCEHLLTWQTGTPVACFSLLDTSSSMEARWRVAGQVASFAMFPCVLDWAVAAVGAYFIYTQTAVLAGRRVQGTLVDVLFARLTWEERCAGADVVGVKRTALAPIGTRVWGTRISLLTVFPYKKKDAFYSAQTWEGGPVVRCSCSLPVQPGGHLHLNVRTLVSSQVPPFPHGKLRQGLSVGVRQRGSMKPNGHLQTKSTLLSRMTCWHSPPFQQGLEAQGLRNWHADPQNLSGHLKEKKNTSNDSQISTVIYKYSFIFRNISI